MLSLRPGHLSLDQLRRLAHEGLPARLDDDWRPKLVAGAAQIEAIAKGTKAVYGVNTGFGLLARERIATDQLRELQKNLVLSHACGVGEELSPEIVRLVMAMKIVGLGRGHSGVRPRVVEQLEAFLAEDLVPCVPAKGSVGASGDLAPLAHVACALLGAGELFDGGNRRAASEALAEHGLEALELGPKEGLALVNGTQVSVALAVTALFLTERVLSAAVVVGMLSLDAVKGCDFSLDERLHAMRGQPGQMDVARVQRGLIAGSAIRASHLHCERVQDPYCIRCQPQVLGACLDQMRHAARILQIEANSVSDNPLFFPEDDDVVSGGNFHAEPVAFAADNLALAIAEIGSIGERCIALMVDPNLSQLPAFLVESSGLNSGFMLAHVTAAAVASDNKALAHPASVDSIPTSANQEDHVSMSTTAARRLHEMVDNSATIVGIQLLCAAQGVEFRRPLRSTPALEEFVEMLRERVPRYERDRMFTADIEAARQLVLEGAFFPAARELLPSYMET